MAVIHGEQPVRDPIGLESDYNNKSNVQTNTFGIVDHSWPPKERLAVVAYLRKGESYVLSKVRPNTFVEPFAFDDSFTFCPYCCGIPVDDLGVGMRCDDRFAWPHAYAHCVKYHGVRPPSEFLDHVRPRLRSSPVWRLAWWLRWLAMGLWALTARWTRKNNFLGQR